MQELDFLEVIRVLQSLSLGGISLAVLVVILTEVVKEFTGVSGKGVRAVALGIGFVLAGISYGLAEGLIPAAAEPYVTWFFVALAGGLGGMGLWHLGKRFLGENIEGQLLTMDPDPGARYNLTDDGYQLAYEQRLEDVIRGGSTSD